MGWAVFGKAVGFGICLVPQLGLGPVSPEHMPRVVEEPLAALACQAGLYSPALTLAASLALGAGQTWDEEGRAATAESSLHRGVPGGGGRWWSGRPLSLSSPSPVPLAAGLHNPSYRRNTSRFAMVLSVWQ